MIKTGSDFSGVGAFDQALRKLGIDYKTVYACDWDKYARQTYIENYGEPTYFPKDVYEREIPKESLDIYMTSPPCQAFSLAGQRKGEADDRGVLFYNSHEFIKINKPRYFIFENVKGLLSDDGGKTFQRWLDYLGGKSVNGNPVIFPRDESVPYHIYHQVLNAKHYGVPQNRERVFIIGIRDDSDNTFTFPKDIHLTNCLKDVLEDNVDEKYYLSKKMIAGFSKHTDRHKEKGNGFKWQPKTEDDVANCLRASSALGVTDNTLKVGFINQDTQASSVFHENGTSPALSSGTHGYAQGYVQVKSACNQGVFIYGYTRDKKGKVIKRNKLNHSNTIHSATGSGGNTDQFASINHKIRRLTPRECFRLMDFPDTFTWTVSDTQAYKQAGNSIVVNVLTEILKKLKL